MTLSITRKAHPCDALAATLESTEPMLYVDGPDVSADRPAHVRSASGVRLWRGQLAVVQDDAHFIALRDADGRVSAIPLPRGADGRRVFCDELGNKAAKWDLEACVVLPDGRFVAFGSGSTPERKRIIVLDDEASTPNAVQATAFYTKLAQCVAFAGSELNIEGVVLTPERTGLRFYQRGNGAVRGEIRPQDATCEVDLAAFLEHLDHGGPLPELEEIVAYDLGDVRGVKLTFTDATPIADGRDVFVACAEDSPDTYADGEVVGCSVGVIDGDDVRIVPVVDRRGKAPVHTTLKMEGIEPIPGDPRRFWTVVDDDDTSTPALLCVVRIDGLDGPA